MAFSQKFILGVLLSLALAFIAIFLAKLTFFQHLGISSLILAILIGLLIGNIFYPKIAPFCQVGVDWSKGKILRLAIILFGIKLTFQDIMFVGLNGIIVDAIMVFATFFITFYIGTKWLKLEKNSAILIGSGCSICGAAAIIATESTLKAKTEQVAIAVAVIVIFGSIAMFVYPFIYQVISAMRDIDQSHFGIYIGSTIHEVAQVVAASNAISEQAVETAVITKMIRVLMLAPFLLALSFYLVKSQPIDNINKTKNKIVIPWFAIGFLLMACINSLHVLPAELVKLIIFFDDIFLTMAMAALGLTTHYSAFKKAGIKPLLLGMIIFIWLIVGGGLVNYFII